MADAVPASDTGTTAGDLAEQVLLVSRFYASPEGTVFSQLLAATVTDEGGAAYFRAWFLAGRRTAIAAIWQRGVERGDVRPGVDADTATDLLFGPLVYRLMTGHLPLTDEAATAVARRGAARTAHHDTGGLTCVTRSWATPGSRSPP